MSVANYLKAVGTRRSVYAMKPELPAGVSIQDVQDVVQAIVKHTPTSFNSQVNRAIILTGDAHKRVWNHVYDQMPDEAMKRRPQTIRDESYGSIIFFTDDVITEKLQAQFPMYASAFPRWADHSSGAAQMHVWTVLHELGIGGNLQHYDGYVKGVLPEDIPVTWKVHSQLAFGTPTAEPGEKAFAPNPVQVYA